MLYLIWFEWIFYAEICGVICERAIANRMKTLDLRMSDLSQSKLVHSDAAVPFRYGSDLYSILEQFQEARPEYLAWFADSFKEFDAEEVLMV